MPVRETHAMIAGMSPVRQPGSFVFATLDAAPPEAIATIREVEGLSVLLPTETAAERGLATDMPMAMITLQVNSALDGIGLTAAVSRALTDIDVPCNVVAGHHHDHIFVPEVHADLAIAALRAVAENAA